MDAEYISSILHAQPEGVDVFVRVIQPGGQEELYKIVGAEVSRNQVVLQLAETPTALVF